MRVLFLLPLALAMAACSYAPNVHMPYRIDVQQGNALELESVEKLKPGLTRSQVRFLLGTPLLVDPFHNNRWDYVYNYRRGGKLTVERRLVLFFDGDTLVRIEAEGFPPKGELPAPKPGVDNTTAPKSDAAAKPAVVQPAAVAEPAPPPEPVAPQTPAAIEARAVPVVAAESPKPKPIEQAQAKPDVETAPAVAKPVSVQAVSSSQNTLNETSVVAPLQSDVTKPKTAAEKPPVLKETPPEPVVLQTESNVAAVKTDAMPVSAGVEAPPVSAEEKIIAALDSWTEAWRSRNDEAYLAAYAPNFRPEGGESKEEWEKRRRLLLGVTRNIDLRIDGVATEIVTEDRAHVSFRQFYRSDSYQDAVIKQLKFVRVDNLWLIEEERVLAPIKVAK